MNVTLYTDAETRLRDAAPELADALRAMLRTHIGAAFDADASDLKARVALAKAGIPT